MRNNLRSLLFFLITTVMILFFLKRCMLSVVLFYQYYYSYYYILSFLMFKYVIPNARLSIYSHQEKFSSSEFCKGLCWGVLLLCFPKWYRGHSCGCLCLYAPFLSQWPCPAVPGHVWPWFLSSSLILHTQAHVPAQPQPVPITRMSSVGRFFKMAIPELPK